MQSDRLRSEVSREAGGRVTLVPAGSIGRFERWLDYPAWFRKGTALPPYPAPIPALLSMADDLTVLENIVLHGQAETIFKRLVSNPGFGFAARWSAALALSPSLHDALDLLVTKLSVDNVYFRLDWESDGRRAAIRVSSPVTGPARVLVVVAPVLVLVRQVTSRIGEMPGCKIAFDVNRQGGLDELLAPFGLQACWNAPVCRLSLPHEWLAETQDDPDPVLWSIARQRLLAQPEAHDQLALSVVTHIGTTLASKRRVPRLAEVAVAVGLSERTLVRRLAQAEMSYTVLVEQERRKLADVLLREPDRALQDVAEALGYADAARFGRAFRKWFGTSPARYRRRVTRATERLA